MDITWLQRDLGLYIVGLFDTYHASRALGYQKHSLASLLHKFVNFDAQKKYQLADWRIRPIPSEMFDYARSDTHFLLYIYDNMRNELLEKSDATLEKGGLVEYVLEESKKVALQRYERSIYDKERGMGTSGWYQMLIRTPAIFSKEQFAVFRAVHQWRDDIARKEDESVNEIMNKQSLFNIARELPSDIGALLGCTSPISHPVRMRASELLSVVKKAKESGATGPEMKDFMKEHPATIATEAEKAARYRSLAQERAGASVGAVIQSLRETRSVQDLRATTSQFWGSTVSSTATQNATVRKTPISLALPLPALTAEVFVDKSGLNSKKAKETALPEHPYIKERSKPESSVFVVKEVGGSRKRKADAVHAPSTTVESTEEAANEDVVMAGNDTLAAEEKAERKAARKAQRKLEKQERKAANAEEKEKDDDTPFDYASAPSVMNAKPNTTLKPGSKPVFDPYQKSMNAPKGMRKVQKEIAGRSLTYKS
jgi:exosome complex exonuclease RRP6